MFRNRQKVPDCGSGLTEHSDPIMPTPSVDFPGVMSLDFADSAHCLAVVRWQSGVNVSISIFP